MPEKRWYFYLFAVLCNKFFPPFPSSPEEVAQMAYLFPKLLSPEGEIIACPFPSSFGLQNKETKHKNFDF